MTLVRNLPVATAPQPTDLLVIEQAGPATRQITALNLASVLYPLAAIPGLSSATNAAQGAALVGYGPSLTYPINTVGYNINAAAITAAAAQSAANAAQTTANTAQTTATSASTTAGAASLAVANLAASGGSSSVGFLQSGTGAVSRTVQAKDREIVSVVDYGAVGDGSTDDTPAFQRAHDALPSTGGEIRVPRGGFWVVAGLNITKPGVKISGQGQGATALYQATHNSDFITCNQGNLTIEALTFNAAAYGAVEHFALVTSGTNLVMVNVSLVGLYSGISTTGIISNLRGVSVVNLKPVLGTGMKVNNALATVELTDCLFGNAAGNNCFAGLLVTQCGSLQLNGCQFFKMGTALYVLPGVSQLGATIQAVNCFFDTSVSGMILDATAASSVIQSCQFSNCWFNGHSGVGGRARGNVKGVLFTGCQFNSNGSDGWITETSAVTGLSFVGCAAAANGGSGFDVAANASNHSFVGNVAGPWGTYAANAGYGIQFQAGTGANNTVVGNTLQGNITAALLMGCTGVGNNFSRNSGANGGAGVTAPTVTASPMTYTAGASEETLFIRGGTVSLITVESATVFSSSNVTVKLRAHQSAVITYSSAPAIVSLIE